MNFYFLFFLQISENALLLFPLLIFFGVFGNVQAIDYVPDYQLYHTTILILLMIAMVPIYIAFTALYSAICSYIMCSLKNSEEEEAYKSTTLPVMLV